MKNHSLFGYGRSLFCPVLIGSLLISAPNVLANNPVGTFSNAAVLVQQQISGTVSDALAPMPDVTVAVKGSNIQARTDANGRYSISASIGNILVFSYMGYSSVEVVVSSLSADIMMQADSQSIQEVVINAGYYSVKESERTGSIARITAKDIENQPVSNVLATMQGRMAGVSISQNTGVPGGGFDIKIRGQNSLRMDGNSPMYIVDGVPYSSESLTDGATSGVLAGKPSPLNSIPPEQIETIEVLKDADATAIYGSRGANGVVLITTKKGKGGKTAFNARFTRGAGKVTRFMKLLSTEQYLSVRREGFANDGMAEYPEYAYDVNGTWDQNRYTDWQEELLGGMAENSTAQLSIAGGSERTTFLISGGYNEQSTVFPGDFKYRSGNVRAAIGHRSEDGRLKIAFSAGLTAQGNNLPSIDFTSEAISIAPNAPALYDVDGNINWENSTFNNPLRNILSKYKARTSDVLSSLSINYEIADGLEAIGSFGYTATEHDEINTAPSTIYFPVMGIGPEFSSIAVTDAKRNSWIAEPQLHWKKEIGRHRMDVLAGSTFQMQKGEQLVQTGYGFSSDRLIENLGAASSIYILANDKKEYRYQAFFGRANYIFNDRYILNVTGRRDGSSRFGPGKQFANFWAFGGAWLLSKEKFLEESTFLSLAKIRGSYGITGSDQIGDYQFLDTYSTTGIAYGGQIGLQPTRLYNPNFAWETNRKFEAAVEAGFLKDRIFVTAAFYRNKSSNQLTGIPLPGTTGFSSVQANFDAAVENTGTEITVRTSNIETANFSWSTSFNISVSKNKLLSFPGLEGSTYASRYVIGNSLNILKLYKYEGVNPETGIYQFADTNGDGTVDYLDMTEVADLTPKFFGGLQNEFRYKGLRLDFLFQFVKQQNRNLARLMGTPGGMSNQTDQILSHWQQPGDVASVQIYTAGFNTDAVIADGMYSSSTAVVTDASFIRLKNISLTYEVPLQKKLGVNCQLSVQAQNLFTITSFKGGDPEFTSGGYLPPLRIITAGIALGF